MKPKKRTRWIEIGYWDCGMNAHSHKSETAAQNCITRQEASQRAKSRPQKEALKARRLLAARMVINGDTFAKAGKDIGVSGGRCNQIVRQVLRQSMHPRFGNNVLPCSPYDIAEVRLHADYWLGRLADLEDHWKA
jgi:hypothetical protein